MDDLELHKTRSELHRPLGAALGLDPGRHSGGAALLVGERVEAWWAWTWLSGRGGRYRVRRGDAGGVSEAELESLHVLGLAVARSGPWDVLVVEGLYTPRGRRVSPQSIVPLAEAAGEVLGPLRQAAGRIKRPLASVWRRDVLGLAGQGARECEAYARAWAMRSLGWACEPWDALTEGEGGAVAEAACMAYHGVRS